jgi:Amt family ammonium transporter
VGGADGLLAGNAGQVGLQVLGVVAVGLYSAVATAVILFLVNLVVPIRVAGPEEETGLDLAQHGEVAYQV